MEENKRIFSCEVENAYKTETENALEISDGFKSSVFEKIKREKQKSRKRLFIGISSVAAAVILAFGAALATDLFDSCDMSEDDLEYAMNGDAVQNGGSNIEKSDDGTNEDFTSSSYNTTTDSSPSDEITSDFLNSLLYDDGNELLNWYSFYDLVVAGKIGASPDALEYVEKCYDFFETSEMEDELGCAKTVINLLSPFDGFSEIAATEESVDAHTFATSAIKSYILINVFKSGDEELNWYEFYNACIEGEIDPRVGAAKEFLSEAYGFFDKNGYTEGKEQAQLLLSKKLGG